MKHIEAPKPQNRAWFTRTSQVKPLALLNLRVFLFAARIFYEPDEN
jgi:hypothetical protein